MWARPEGLASVASALFLDLPTRQELAEAHVPAGPTLADQARQQLLEVKVRALSPKN